MYSKTFYATKAANAIPLFLVTKPQWEQGLETLTSNERNCFATQQFTGKFGEFCLINDNDGLPRKAYIGAGDGNQVLALASAAIRLPPASYLVQEPLSHTAKVMWSLAQYRFTDYKKQEWKARALVVEENLEAILAEADAVFLVRNLINAPTNDLGPKELAERLAAISSEFNAEFQQWVGEELLSANLQAIHAVGRASANAPRLLSLTWGNEHDPRITLIGKGVCFDSGGLDIKPSSGMRLMKKDMGGAAHALGLAQWIMARKLPVYLQVFIPAVENAIGPDAFRPGDIIKMHNGLTVEIDNTDAEGRLVLADAISKACETQKPDLLIDFATLTGAARVAVGTEIAAMFTNNEQLAQAINDSSLAVDDPVWRLPLFAAYESLLDSSIADLVNSSPSPYAGAITAALFLQRFIPKSLPWVHFDIMAWNVSSKPGKPEGGEAMALRALMHYLEKTYTAV
ncbi:putative cytosol aminopeptidase [Legionella massiliensis]|uniref:Putative cytosol aminopeptidase n=1 Tax=Legionella massiliensis TaxID=1034943 RepID=A0A078KVF8_9GAMM|nr:leucyl aminopeptidase family protein [Legionella massiliensis]CDZ76972.1 putative cytosol aminopeptidase [Legionella massiliensis]CEE12710.1 putative cytosol aminopeptidase [Legionella massiliensis]